MIEINLKELSGHDKSATVGKILVSENQKIKAGDILFNAESSKGNVKVKSEYDGTILKVLIKEGEEVKIGDAIFQIHGEKSNVKAENTKTEKKSSYSFGIAKPKKEDVQCDIAIIGGGPGGYVAAIRAAQLGAKVTLIEKDRLGGTCLNYGCIPTKSFVKSAHLLDEIKHAEQFGILVDEPKADMAKIVDRKDEVVSTLVGGIQYLLESWNIKYINGEAKLEGEAIVVKNKKVDATIQAKNIILAVGSTAVKLNIPGADLEKVLTNKEILELKEIPQALTIIGGGIIGMEFAFIFDALGSKVTVIEYMDTTLCTLDDDIIEVIQLECDQRNIKYFCSAKAGSILETDSGKLITEFEKDEKRQYTIGDYVLMSVGRRANLDSVELEALNIELNERKNGIKVNNQMKTTNNKFYAIGDVTNIIQLAHVASHQGIVAVENILGQNIEMKYEAIPS
ncbi:MAG: FAD-dependent oxidoreductase, partial [Clostridia bacterium]|nr:FAD-dependent oxidoreductase [Clostridia bacterium]